MSCDGYPENNKDWGTKTYKRLRLATEQTSPDYMLDENTVL